VISTSPKERSAVELLFATTFKFEVIDAFDAVDADAASAVASVANDLVVEFAAFAKIDTFFHKRKKKMKKKKK
jgi:hypothetical protein